MLENAVRLITVTVRRSGRRCFANCNWIDQTRTGWLNTHNKKQDTDIIYKYNNQMMIDFANTPKKHAANQGQFG